MLQLTIYSCVIVAECTG